MPLITLGLSPDQRRAKTRKALERYAGMKELAAPLVLRERYGELALAKGYAMHCIPESEVKIALNGQPAPEGLFWFVITTDQVDRSNDRVSPKGVGIRNFMDNPVVLWSHDSQIPAIGRIEAIRSPFVLSTGHTGILAGLRFQTVTELARDVGELVKQGFIRACSIGFIPLVWSDESASKYTNAYPFTNEVRTYEESELLELSVCNIPMNPGASVREDLNRIVGQAVQQGVIAFDSEFIRTMGLEPTKVIATTTDAGSGLQVRRTTANATEPVLIIEQATGIGATPVLVTNDSTGGIRAYRNSSASIPIAIHGDGAFTESTRKEMLANVEAGELSFRDLNGNPIAIESLYFQDSDGKYRSLTTGEVATPPEEYFQYRSDPPTAKATTANTPAPEDFEDKSLLTLLETFTPDTMDISSLAEKAGLSVEQFTAAMDAVKEEAAKEKNLASELAKRDACDEIWDIHYALSEVRHTAMRKYLEDSDSTALDNLPMDYADAANRTVALIKSIPAEQYEAALQSMGEYRAKGFAIDKAGATLNAANKEAVKLIQKSASVVNGEVNIIFENAKKLLDSAGMMEEDANPESVTKTTEDNAPLLPAATTSDSEEMKDRLTDIEAVLPKIMGKLATIEAQTKPPLPGEVETPVVKQADPDSPPDDDDIPTVSFTLPTTP